jgi:hypothetical protein
MPVLSSGHAGTNHAFYLGAYEGALWGNGLRGSHCQGALKVGDRVGVLVQLGKRAEDLPVWKKGEKRKKTKSDDVEGEVRFFVNGSEYGPGFRGLVQGPLVLGVEMGSTGQAVRLLPFAKEPATEKARCSCCY